MRSDSKLSPPAEGRAAPGPKGPARWWTLLHARLNRLGALERAARRYGNLVDLSFGGQPTYLVFQPEHLRQVLEDDAEFYPGAAEGPALSALLGRGLATLEGPPWRRHRKLLEPAFRYQRMAAIVGAMARATEAMLAGWRHAAEQDREVDLPGDLRHLTFRIAVETILGSGAAAEVERLRQAWYAVTDDLRGLAGGGQGKPSVADSLATLHAITDGEIGRHRQAASDQGDLLSMLLESRDEQGAGLSDLEVRDEVMNLFFGAYDTTSTALFWTLIELGRQPRWEERVAAEARDLRDRLPGAEDLKELKLIRNVFQEALRLYPPAWLFGRRAARDGVLGGFHIPRGAALLLCPFLTHRLPEHWPDAESFDPDRFLAERSAGRERCAYLPFGRGGRQCIGTNFALMEAQVVLGMILSRFHLAPRRWPPPPRRAGLVRAPESCLVRLAPRPAPDPITAS